MNINHIITEFEVNANTKEAKAMEGYMRNQFKFYGIKSPQRKAIQSKLIKQYGYPEIKDYKLIILQLWEAKQRELQYFAMDLLKVKVNYFDNSYVDFFETLILTKSWWDTIDFIAPNLVGILLLKDKELRDKYINKWINSNNFWLQRVTIIHQLRHKNNTDFNLLKKLILQTASQDEFFIQKAIGWSLREYSKTEPELVKEFITSVELKPLSTKEGLKHINKKNL